MLIREGNGQKQVRGISIETNSLNLISHRCHINYLLVPLTCDACFCAHLNMERIVWPGIGPNCS